MRIISSGNRIEYTFVQSVDRYRSWRRISASDFFDSLIASVSGTEESSGIGRFGEYGVRGSSRGMGPDEGMGAVEGLVLLECVCGEGGEEEAFGNWR